MKAFAFALTLAAAGCSQSADRDQLTQLQQRVDELQAKVETMQQQLDDQRTSVVTETVLAQQVAVTDRSGAIHVWLGVDASQGEAALHESGGVSITAGNNSPQIDLVSATDRHRVALGQEDDGRTR